jgi:hypothetical protein
MMYDDLTHRVFLKCPTTDTDTVDRWCYEHFGEQGDKWDAWFADDSLWNYDQIYAFVNHEDAVLFTLTWV